MKKSMRMASANDHRFRASPRFKPSTVRVITTILWKIGSEFERTTGYQLSIGISMRQSAMRRRKVWLDQ
jgi:hypothetical protein